jgi:hypothetical protein
MGQLPRKLLAVFFALWLPFSAVAAAMMPMCAHENAKQMHAAYIAQPGCEHHDGGPDQIGSDDSATTGECAQSALCMFACTPWLPGMQSSLEAISSFAAIDGIFPALRSLVFPPADRPPLAAA